MTCLFEKPNRKSCQAKPLEGEDFCYFHHPEMQKKRKKSQAKGGQTKQIILKEPLPPIVLANPQDVVFLLQDTINRVRSGEMDVKTGNCMGVLSGHLIKALEVSSIATKVEIIHRAILENKNHH
jgi:hypothetical protein